MSVSASCSFRVIGLTDEQVSALVERHLSDLQYRKGSDHRDRSRKLLRLILDESIDAKLLEKLLSESPKDVYYDFFISVSSSEETIVVDIPDYVLLLRERVGGKMCLSYTCA